LGVLAAIVPEGADVPALQRLVLRGAPVDSVLRVAALLTGDVLAFAVRLKLSLAERDRLVALRATPLAKPENDDAALRRLLADTQVDVLLDKTWLEGGESPAWDSLRDRLRSLPVPIFPLEGRDIVAMGVLPGPKVGDVLRTVRAWWLAGGCVAAKPDCLTEAGRLIEG